MICRACSAPLDAHGVFPGGHLTCAACGADNVTPAPSSRHDSPYREPAKPTPPPMKPSRESAHAIGPLCPRCTRVLHDSDDHDALACGSCHGSFVDHTTLSACIQHERPVEPPPHPPAPRRSPPPELEVRYVHCPRCDETMTRMNFGRRSGVIVDVCRAHGTWFDGGEREAVMEFVRAGGIEAELFAPAAPTVESIAMVRDAEKMLALESSQWQHHVAEEVLLANDVLFVLFGGTRYRVWR